MWNSRWQLLRAVRENNVHCNVLLDTRELRIAAFKQIRLSLGHPLLQDQHRLYTEQWESLHQDFCGGCRQTMSDIHISIERCHNNARHGTKQCSGAYPLVSAQESSNRLACTGDGNLDGSRKYRQPPCGHHGHESQPLSACRYPAKDLTPFSERGIQ